MKTFANRKRDRFLFSSKYFVMIEQDKDETINLKVLGKLPGVHKLTVNIFTAIAQQFRKSFLQIVS